MFTHKGRVPSETAKEMTLEDIRVTIEDHVHAAKCAIAAGFDGVEIVSYSIGHADSTLIMSEVIRQWVPLRPISQ